MTNTITKIKDLCFNFGIGNRTLIYVKKDKSVLTNTTIEKIEVSNLTENPNLSNINDDIKKLKNTSDLELLVELEHIINKKIDVTKIKKGVNRDLLEKKILQRKLNEMKSKPIINKEPQTNEIIETTNPISEPVTEPETVPEIKDEEEKKGGKTLTKKELIIKITNKLLKFKKDKLLEFYENL